MSIKELLKEQPEAVWGDLSRSQNETDALSPSPVGPLLATARDLPNFIGRDDELATIIARLESGGSVNISAIRAQGGMGKTWLAERVAQLVKERFPTAIKLALNGLSDTPTTTVQAMKDVITRFQPTPEALPNTVAELRPRYLAVLARHKPLVILDNARDGKQIEDLIIERPEGVGFIVTSRKLIVLGGIETVPLDKLSKAEAMRLIRSIAGETRGTDDEIREVATLCSRLPLALHIAATFLRVKSNWAVSRYLEALKKKRLEMLKLDGVDDVEAVLALSVTQLIHDDAEQAERLQMLSVFPGDFDDAAAAAVWGFEDDNIAFEQLDGLLSRSLILEAEGGRWELHDLIRPIAQQAFHYVEDGHPLKASGADRLKLAQQCHAEHYVEVLREANEGPLANGLTIYDLEATNISTGRAWADAHAASDTNAAKQFIFYSLNGAKLYLYRYSAIDQEELYKRCLELSVLGEFRDWEAQAKSYLGDALATLGQVNRALVLYGEAADLHQELGEVREKAVTIGKRADLLVLQGNTEEALRDLEQIKILFHDIDDQGAKAVTMGKIAYIYEKLGQTDKALRIRRDECLPIYKSLGGEREIAVTMAKIAHHLQGDEALDIYHEVLPLFERLGDANAKAVTMVNIADIHEQRGETTEALRIYNFECIPAFERLGDVRSKAGLMGRIANIHERRDETNEALRIRREEILPVYERLGDVWAKMMCRANIGITLMNKSVRTKAESEEAREHLLWALATAEKHQYAEAAQLCEYVTQLGFA